MASRFEDLRVFNPDAAYQERTGRHPVRYEFPEGSFVAHLEQLGILLPGQTRAYDLLQSTLDDMTPRQPGAPVRGSYSVVPLPASTQRDRAFLSCLGRLEAGWTPQLVGRFRLRSSWDKQWIEVPLFIVKRNSQDLCIVPGEASFAIADDSGGDIRFFRFGGHLIGWALMRLVEHRLTGVYARQLSAGGAEAVDSANVWAAQAMLRLGSREPGH